MDVSSKSGMGRGVLVLELEFGSLAKVVRALGSNYTDHSEKESNFIMDVSSKLRAQFYLACDSKLRKRGSGFNLEVGLGSICEVSCLTLILRSGFRVKHFRGT